MTNANQKVYKKLESIVLVSQSLLSPWCKFHFPCLIKVSEKGQKIHFYLTLIWVSFYRFVLRWGLGKYTHVGSENIPSSSKAFLILYQGLLNTVSLLKAIVWVMCEIFFSFVKFWKLKFWNFIWTIDQLNFEISFEQFLLHWNERLHPLSALHFSFKTK